MKIRTMLLLGDPLAPKDIIGKRTAHVYLNKKIISGAFLRVLIFESNEPFTIGLTVEGLEGEATINIDASMPETIINPVADRFLFKKSLRSEFRVTNHKNIINSALKGADQRKPITIVAVKNGSYESDIVAIGDYLDALSRFESTDKKETLKVF